jgi:hypothetical protein
MIWKKFFPPPINKLIVYYNGQPVYMKRYDGRGPSVLIDPYGPPRDYWPKRKDDAYSS